MIAVPSSLRHRSADRCSFFRSRSGAREVGTTLHLRLSLLITALLAMVTTVGGAYVIHKAREDITQETASTIDLTRHFFDAKIEDVEEQWAAHGFAQPDFKLGELHSIRHLRVSFLDARGQLIDSNWVDERAAAPRWFATLVRSSSRPVATERLNVSFQGSTVGSLLIEPEPRFETDEMWDTCSGLMGLLLIFFFLVNALVWVAASRALRPVERILQGLRDLRAGNLSARLPAFRLPELSRISVGFNHMAETLEKSLTENQRLTRQLIETQETERTSVARELHDEIGQFISAIHADAAAIKNIGGGKVQESADAIINATTHLKSIVRTMLKRLRPPLIEGVGLGPALGDLVTSFRHRNGNTRCTLSLRCPLDDISVPISLAVYRITQECLTNIAVHADARNVSIVVSLKNYSNRGPQGAHAAGRDLRILVTDDGAGFRMSEKPGLGLTGIKERVAALGGRLLIDARPGCGTRIVLRIPVDRTSEAAP
jgi:two-component system, NarL family, sensor histidine kinase UhpB